MMMMMKPSHKMHADGDVDLDRVVVVTADADHVLGDVRALAFKLRIIVY